MRQLPQGPLPASAAAIWSVTALVALVGLSLGVVIPGLLG